MQEQRSELFLASTCFGSASWRPLSAAFHRNKPTTRRAVESVLVYAVDDDEELTELYALLLAGAGYRVRAFNHRAKALATLEAEVNKPNLLITDYFGLSMDVHQFMQACRVVHPSLRVLMASGYDQPSVRLSSMSPNRFIKKPFTPKEFLQEVEAALAG